MGVPGRVANPTVPGNKGGRAGRHSSPAEVVINSLSLSVVLAVPAREVVRRLSGAKVAVKISNWLGSEKQASGCRRNLSSLATRVEEQKENYRHVNIYF